MNDRIIDPEKTGKFIAELRASRNLTQDQLGSMIYISRKSISKWETGRACPSVDMLKKLSEVLDVSMEELIAGEFLDHNHKDLTFVFKVLKNKVFKITSMIVGVVLFLIISICIMNHFSTDKIFVINYEDEDFTVSNGVIVLSEKKGYIYVGNFYCNVDDIDDSTSFGITLYYMDGEHEIEVMHFNKDRSLSMDSDTYEILKNLDEKGEMNKLRFRVRYISADGNTKTYFLKLDIHETDSYEKDKTDHDIDPEEKESPNIEINLNFFFDLEESEIKECYSGKKIKVDGEEYKLSYDDSSKTLDLDSIKSKIAIIYRDKKIYFDTDDIQVININDNNSFDDLSHYNYNLLLNITKELQKITCGHQK